jgi:hypothetical protein
VIAPGKRGVLVGEIREIAAFIEIAPRISTSVSPLRSVFPFRFCRQSIFLALAHAKPLAKFDHVEAANVNDRVAIAGGRRALTFVGGIEGLEVSIGNRKPRHIKPGDGSTKMRCFVRGCAGKRIAHDEFSGWNK